MPFLHCMHWFKKKKKKQFADLTKSLDVETQRSRGENTRYVPIIGFLIYPDIQLPCFKATSVPILDKLVYNIAHY